MSERMEMDDPTIVKPVLSSTFEIPSTRKFSIDSKKLREKKI